MEFKIGDRVKHTGKDCARESLTGTEGTVVDIESINILISFDNWHEGHDGHDGYNNIANRSGRWCKEDQLELLSSDFKISKDKHIIVKTVKKSQFEHLCKGSTMDANTWEIYKEMTGIYIVNEIAKEYSHIDFYRSCDTYNIYPIITYGEYVKQYCDEDTIVTTTYGITGAPTSCLTWEKNTLFKEENRKKLYKLINNKNNVMTNIVKFAKELTLSQDEKLMRKVGLKDEDGEYTDEAQELVIAKLIKDNEEYLIDISRKMIEEDKASKK